MFDVVMPERLTLYETPDGRRVFSIPGASGSPSNLCRIVILDKTRPPEIGVDFGMPGLHSQDGAAWYVVELTPSDTGELFNQKVAEGVAALMAVVARAPMAKN